MSGLALAIVSKLNTVGKLMKAVDDPKLLHSYLELQNMAFELSEEIKTKDETIKKLKTAFELNGKMICIESVHWLKDEDDKTKDGPFCSKCWEVDHIQCHLARLPRDFRPGLKCPNCKARYESCLGFDYIDKQFRSGHDNVFDE